MKYALLFLIGACAPYMPAREVTTRIEHCEDEARAARKSRSVEESMRVYEDCLVRKGLQ